KGHERNVVTPEDGKMGRNHLLVAGKVQPYLEQLQRIGLVIRQQREHLRMDDPTTGGEPLSIAFTNTSSSTKRVRMVAEPAAYQSHGLESPVRMTRKTRHALAVIHAKAIFYLEIHPQV